MSKSTRPAPHSHAPTLPRSHAPTSPLTLDATTGEAVGPVPSPGVPPDLRWNDLKIQMSHADFMMGDALRQHIITGLMMEDLKATVKHGEFGPSLHKHCFPEMSPEEFKDKCWRKAARHMESAAAFCGILQIGHDVQFDNIPLHRLLATPPEAALPEQAQALYKQAMELLRGNSSKQLHLAWKDITPAPKGGKRGPIDAAAASKEKREQAKQFLSMLIGQLHSVAIDGTALTDSGPDWVKLETLKDTLIEAGHKVKAILAKRKVKTPAKERGIHAASNPL